MNKILVDEGVLEQALEALEWSWGGEPMGTLERDAITALRAALAEPVQEPVAWVHPTQGHMQRRTETMSPEVVASYGRGGWTPLYTAPPQRKPLTEEEIKRLVSNDMVQFARAIERAHEIGE